MANFASFQDKRLGRREKLAQKVGRREKLAQKVGRREIYSPVIPPSLKLTWKLDVQVTKPRK